MATKDFGYILDEWEADYSGSQPRKRPEPKWYESLGDYGRITPKEHNYSGTGNKQINRKKLRSMKPQAVLDLHGCYADEAEARLLSFLKQSSEAGLKKIMIIHGKGNHSLGEPVIKKIVVKILERSPAAGEFGHPDRSSGGSGATWVIIR